MLCKHTEIHNDQWVSMRMWYSTHQRRQEYWLPQMRTEDTLPKSKVGSVVYIHISLKSLYFRLSAYKPSACKPTLNKYLSMLAAQCWLDATRSQVLSNKNVTKLVCKNLSLIFEISFLLERTVYTMYCMQFLGVSSVRNILTKGDVVKTANSCTKTSRKYILKLISGCPQHT